MLLCLLFIFKKLLDFLYYPLWLVFFSDGQNESCFRQDFLLKYKNRTEQDEIETRENLNRLLLENVLPAHVAALFVGENKKNEVHLHQGGSGAFKWSQTFFSPFNDLT